jgi:hypothetical protein
MGIQQALAKPISAKSAYDKDNPIVDTTDARSYLLM